MAYRTILFDLDGTLLDTLEDLAASVNVTLESFGYPTRTLEEVRSFVGNGQPMLIRRALPAGVSEEVFQKACAQMKAYYAAHNQVYTRPYDGVMQLLRDLRTAGKKTAVVTNKMDAAAQILCADVFEGLIDAVVGDTEQRQRKPHPDAVYAALDRLGETAEGAVYIGDSEVDVLTARNAGLPLIAVSWGFRSREQLIAAGAETIAADAAGLRELLFEP